MSLAAFYHRQTFDKCTLRRLWTPIPLVICECVHLSLLGGPCFAYLCKQTCFIVTLSFLSSVVTCVSVLRVISLPKSPENGRVCMHIVGEMWLWVVCILWMFLFAEPCKPACLQNPMPFIDVTCIYSSRLGSLGNIKP